MFNFLLIIADTSRRFCLPLSTACFNVVIKHSVRQLRPMDVTSLLGEGDVNCQVLQGRQHTCLTSHVLLLLVRNCISENLKQTLQIYQIFLQCYIYNGIFSLGKTCYKLYYNSMHEMTKENESWKHFLPQAHFLQPITII